MVGKKADKFACFVNGLDMDYIENGFGLDRFRCFLANLAATLYQINFGLICAGFLGLIIVISIFGRIKENYRWFILNQALWDLLISYYFICDNRVAYDIFGIEDPWSCVFYDGEVHYELFFFISNTINSNVYSALFLLSFTRFLCLYFMNFYDKLTRNRRIFWLILSFNFIFIFIHINNLFEFLTNDRVAELKGECFDRAEKNQSKWEDCYVPKFGHDDFRVQLYDTLYAIFSCLVFAKPILCLCFSLFAAAAIIFRIGRQAAFQLKHNRRDFVNSLRVSVVIGLQTVINVCVFGIEFVKNFTSFNYLINYLSEVAVDYILFPPWLDGIHGLSSTAILQAIVQLRIFIESIIVLSIMTGYREALVELIKFVFGVFKNPPKVSRKLAVNLTRVSSHK